ncbi:helicase-related protein [Helicobacter pylori]|uniref:helicase-related protein n=1 Tax=Helicobacter pylori TaxID=210 RepID=UPI00165BC5A6|nr:helicase-related protein [Helicobacter pylori]
MQKKKPKNPQPNLFSILDNGNIATNNPAKESDKINAIQDPLPYVVKTQINTASMISRNPIEWARYLSFEKRVYKDNSKEDVRFFANGEIKESSRVYEANKEGFERRITKRYDLIDTIKNRKFFPREIEILTHTNSLEELKEQGLEIQLTHHNETHKKTLENGNEIVKEYDYFKDIYQEVERTQDGKLIREIIPSISSAEYFKLYDKLPFESINNENTKLNTNANEEVKKLEFELAKEAHALILEQRLLSATDYYPWIDKDDDANFAWKMHRLINENKLKENHLSADNANKIKQFFFNNGFILGWTKEEISAMQENRDYSLKSDLLSLEEIAQAKIELQKYYESVYVNGDGNQRDIKPFKEILRDINNFEKAYQQRYNKLVRLNEAIIQAKESSNERQNSNAKNNNPINNRIETNTSIGNNIIQNNDNNYPNLSLADLELEQQNLGEPNGKERTNRADEPSRARVGIPQEIHRRSEHGGQQEGVERSSDEELSHQDSSLFTESREQGGTRGVYRSSDQQAVSEKPHRERDRLHEHVFGGDGVSARADSNGVSTQASSPASRMENGARSEEKGDNPHDERGVSRPPQSPSHQQNSSRDLGLSLSREQPGQTGRLRLFNHGQMGSLFPTDHENQRSQNDNELDKSSDRANENGDRSPRQNGSANQEGARSERYGIAPRSSDQSVSPPAQSRSHPAGLSTPNGLGDLEENRDQEGRLLSNLDNLESLLNAIRNNTIASEPDFRSRLLEAIQNNESLKDSIVGTQLLKDPTTKVFYDKFQVKISPKKILEILENRIQKSIETANEALNAFNALDSQAMGENAISNSVGLNPTQESKITDNSVELNNAQEQTAQERDTQETAQTTLKQETQERETPTTPTIALNPKIDFKPSEEVLIKGAKTRYKANIKAIELLKELQAKQEILKGDYYATQEEQEILAQFSGWGGLESYFKKDQHPEEFKELNALLTKDEFRRAYSSTRDAYYTPKLVIDSIYQALDQLGFNNDNHQKEIFEPSLGTGKFIAHAPSDKNYRFIGTELDPISANISQFLYPNQVIQNTALENHYFYQEYDAFVGNPPYGNHKIYSSNDKELSNESVHNYFLGKAIKELKEEELVNAEKNFERQELAYKNNPRETKKPNERAFKNKLDKIRAQYDAILEKQGSYIDISQMGIDNLIVDEAHLFKNLAFETSMEKIAGLGNQQGSNRARDLFIKTCYLHQNDKKIMFLTGTPIANSLSEMYHLQRYLTPEVLKERGLEFFDDWAKTYGEVVNDFELDTSAQSYKMVNRFSKFSDVQGLSTMYRAFADIVSNDDILKHNPHFVPKVYGDKPINVVVKRSEEVAQFIGVADENGKYNEGSIIDRMQKCEGKKSKKGQDNILSCTTDARKVALDYRLIDPNAKVEKEFSKSYAMAKNIYENYLETNATKGTQLGFIGLSTPKTHSQKVSLEAPDNDHKLENKNPLDETQELLESLSSYDENGNLIAPSKKELENELKEKNAKGVNLDEELAKGSKFDVYSDVLRHLVQMGIPQNEIAFIHDAKTEEQKQDLFKRVNRGEVRVLLGSPAKMGVGTNVQTRLVAMHELDCPWRPDELLQMEGRGIRQGNILHQNDPENFRMKIYRYATEKTYDSRMWQIIETKSKGIEQFRNAHKLGLNELEDFNMGSSNASEMKAEATGNPLIIEEVKLRAEIKSEESKYKAFNKEHYFNEENLKNNASKLDYLKQELKDLETLQSSVIIPTHTEIKLYDLKNEESKDYELIKVKEVEPLKENASMSEELAHKKLKEQNKQIAEQNKEKLDAIKKQFASNLNDLFFNEERDCKLLEYKGFVVNAYKTKYQVEFSLSPKDNPNIAYSPSNMVYKNDTGNMFSSYNFCGEIKFDGFLKRLDNAITKLPEKIKELENSIETTQENIAKYTRLVEQKLPYPRLEYLQTLKWDHKTLIDDLAKMGKDRDYKPAFNPKSKEVLEKMNAEKRASLENEREEVKEQANQEVHRPMKKAANDDYDMAM